MSDSGILRFLYNTVPGRGILKILVNPKVSVLAGTILNSRLSALYVPHFVKKNNIDLSGCEKKKFDSFNDFFTRRKTCNINAGDNDIISPCDGYLSIYRIKGGSINIKNSSYTIKELLKSRKLADRFADGYCLIFRLEPVHYHRYVFITDAAIKCQRRIDGVLHCVRPVAFDKYPVYVENSREYTVMKGKELGLSVQMEVGALLVGKIHNHTGIDEAVKGREKGYFEFGGSTIVVLVENGRLKLLNELEKECDTAVEIPVKLGDLIGKGCLGV